MTKPPERRLVLVSREAHEGELEAAGSPWQEPAPPQGQVLGEVIIDGRRYRLVPLDAEPPAEREAPPAPPALTAREAQIARLVADGFVNKQIAAELRISEWTVATHLRRIFAKLGVETRAAMVSKCFGGR